MAVREGSDLCWAHEGEVQWVEEEHNILALQTGMLSLQTFPQHMQLTVSCQVIPFATRVIEYSNM